MQYRLSGYRLVTGAKATEVDYTSEDRAEAISAAREVVQTRTFDEVLIHGEDGSCYQIYKAPSGVVYEGEVIH